jgi:hypothetical protein
MRGAGAFEFPSRPVLPINRDMASTPAGESLLLTAPANAVTADGSRSAASHVRLPAKP